MIESKVIRDTGLNNDEIQNDLKKVSCRYYEDDDTLIGRFGECYYPPPFEDMHVQIIEDHDTISTILYKRENCSNYQLKLM